MAVRMLLSPELEYPMELAQQGNSGQSRIVADFLLAWWNADECGGFDLTVLWRVDSSIAQDMVTVIGFIASSHRYPGTESHW
jgi:hypothetical protein